MADILASIEFTGDGRILYLKRYSEVRIPMNVGDTQAIQNGRLELRDTKKMGLHLAIFGRELVGEQCEWVFHHSVKLDRPGVYHWAVKPDSNRQSYSGPGEFYYGYRVRDPQEESDPIHREIVTTWRTKKYLRVDAREDWGEVLDLPDLESNPTTDGTFRTEEVLTDGRVQVKQYFDDHKHYEVHDATYVVVVLRHAPHHRVCNLGISRVYVKPSADQKEVLRTIHWSMLHNFH